jgi:hypothetical protein
VTQQPIFLLSLPRAGSTLVQRILAAHPEVSTTPEPWLLLPQIFAMRERGALVPYGHAPAARAIREFAARLPKGDQDYAAEMRRFVLALYSKASGGRGRYFVDKTPRYHLIAEELWRIFPKARWIFLWRNPVAVAASIVTTWGKGKWRPGQWSIDLLEGPRNLVSAYEGHRDEAFAVRYEDLIMDPMTTWPRLFGYLDLDFDPSLLDALPSVQLPGRMGDRRGAARYRSLSSEPLDKWKDVMRSPVRNRWCRAYLWRIGERELRVMGYEIQSLLGELAALPSDGRRLGADLVNGAYAWTLGAGQRAAMRFFGPRRTLWPRPWPSDARDQKDVTYSGPSW